MQKFANSLLCVAKTNNELGDSLTLFLLAWWCVRCIPFEGCCGYNAVTWLAIGCIQWIRLVWVWFVLSLKVFFWFEWVVQRERLTHSFWQEWWSGLEATYTVFLNMVSFCLLLLKYESKSQLKYENKTLLTIEGVSHSQLFQNTKERNSSSTLRFRITVKEVLRWVKGRCLWRKGGKYRK